MTTDEARKTVISAYARACDDIAMYKDIAVSNIRQAVESIGEIEDNDDADAVLAIVFWLKDALCDIRRDIAPIIERRNVLEKTRDLLNKCMEDKRQ